MADRDWKNVSTDTILNFEGPQTAEIARFNRILQHRATESMNGLSTTIYRASQLAADKNDQVISRFDAAVTKVDEAMGKFDETANAMIAKADDAIAKIDETARAAITKADEAIAKAEQADLSQRKQQMAMTLLTITLRVHGGLYLHQRLGGARDERGKQNPGSSCCSCEGASKRSTRRE
jgi:hypothetical protein